MLTSTLTEQAHPKRRIDTSLTLEKGPSMEKYEEEEK